MSVNDQVLIYGSIVINGYAGALRLFDASGANIFWVWHKEDSVRKDVNSRKMVFFIRQIIFWF